MLGSPAVPTLDFPLERSLPIQAPGTPTRATTHRSRSLVSAIAKFRITAQLGLATVVLMFGLIVLGSIVRTTGSGLACPDWPLCHGRLIPPLQFNVLVEWFHRLLALIVGLGLVGTAVWTASHRATRARLGGLAALCIALYLSQAF